MASGQGEWALIRNDFALYFVPNEQDERLACKLGSKCSVVFLSKSVIHC